MSRLKACLFVFAAFGSVTGCGDSAEKRSAGGSELEAIKVRWERSLKAARSTPPGELGSVGQALHELRRDLDAVETSECLAEGKLALADGMDAAIAEVLLGLGGGGGGSGGSGFLMASISAARYQDIAGLCAMSLREAGDFLETRAGELQAVRDEEERRAEEEHTRIEAQISQAASHCSTLPVLRQPGSEFKDPLPSGAIAPVMVTLPCGGFLMGSTSNADEEPVHPVSIRSFALAKTEVTFDEYDAFAEATGRPKPADGGWGRGRQPVINVSWLDAVAYAGWLSEQTGQSYRLPSEAEWEYAARARGHDDFAWGYDIGYNQANCDGCGSPWDNRQPAPAGSFRENDFGLQDMHGNVWEWVQDCYHRTHKGSRADGTPREDCSPSERVIRGGSWFAIPSWLRSSHRSFLDPGTQRNNGGFRVARDLR